MNPQVEPQRKPKPSWLLTICSILVITGAVLIAGALFSTVFSTDELSIVTGLFFLPFPLIFIFLQYRGTFHQHPDAAGLAGVMALSGSLLLFTVITIGFLGCLTLFNWPGILMVVFIFGIPPLLVGLLFLFFAKINFNWARLLESYYADSVTKPPAFRFSIRELMGAMALVSVIATLGVSFSR